MEDKVRAIIIASGRGTDAEAVIKVWEKGQIPEMEIVLLISTRKEAECLEVAEKHNIPKETIVGYKRGASKERIQQFEKEISRKIRKHRAELVLLLGNIHHIPQVAGVRIDNIHPAHPLKHGGQGMHGLKVHAHVLASILDEINRGIKTEKDNFYTLPTVHEASEGYDQGSWRMQIWVKIPQEIIIALWRGVITLEMAADQLQKHVIKREWLMLPAQVNIAVQDILDERR